MSGQLQIDGEVLGQADAALSNAGVSFVNSSVVQIGADFGSGEVNVALAGFAAALSRATGGSGEQATSQARSAKSAQASFAQLDGQIAASASFAEGPAR